MRKELLLVLLVFLIGGLAFMLTRSGENAQIVVRTSNQSYPVPDSIQGGQIAFEVKGNQEGLDWQVIPPAGTSALIRRPNLAQLDVELDQNGQYTIRALRNNRLIAEASTLVQVEGKPMSDRDGDGVPDEEDAFPDDATEQLDTDGDGVGDRSDAFPEDASKSVKPKTRARSKPAKPKTPKPKPVQPAPPKKAAPKDSDKDGIPDEQDAFPRDPSEWLDSDLDGRGDNADVFPNDPTEWSDLDGDGIGDFSDADRDGDGIDNDNDPDPLNPDIPGQQALEDSDPNATEDAGEVEAERPAMAFSEPFAKGNLVTTGLQAPARPASEDFMADPMKVIVVPKTDVILEGFQYWSGAGIDASNHRCRVTVRCTTPSNSGKDSFYFNFTTPQNTASTDRYQIPSSKRYTLLAGHEYEITIKALTGSIGAVQVGSAQRFSTPVVEVTYPDELTTMFELEFSSR